MGLKNMSDSRELCFKKNEKTMRNVICCLKVHRHLTTIFQAKNCSENIKVVYIFQILWMIKSKIYVSTHQI